MSTVSVNERRDKQIQDALDSRNYKQALQLCDKRIKKGEKNDYLLAWKAYILLSSPEAGRKTQGATESRALCERTPPITDPSALSMLERCLRAARAEDLSIAKLWMNAARARPHDVELQENWMMANFNGGEWKQAQSAAMTLQKNFPKKRHFYFWAILANHLASTSSKASEIDRKLFGPLAFKMITKAASEVPTDPNELLSPPRAIQTLEELLLLLEIYKHQGYVREALAILDGPNLGILSTVGKSNWTLVREKLDLLEKAGMWQEEWDYCRTMLDKAQPSNNRDTTESHHDPLASHGDDWRLWIGLILSSQNIATPPNWQATEEAIEAYVKQEHSSRNSNLALLKFLAQSTDRDPSISPRLLSTCKQYFERNCTKLICYDDLQPYVECLRDKDQEELRLHCAAHAKSMAPIAGEAEAVRVSWLTSEINALKLDYTSRVSRSQSQLILEAFVCNCIRLYKLSSCLGNDRVYSDNKPGDDACILAAMGLIRLSELEHKQYLLLSALLLEFLLARSKHNYQALLTLVRVHVLLGTGSLALKTYKRLAIKNLQHETLSHVLFTRFATIHPHPARMEFGPSTERKDKDPISAVEAVLESYRSSARQAAVGKRLFLENGRYSMLLGVLEIEDTMQRSLSKVMCVLERRRMKRLTRADQDEEYLDLLVPSPQQMHDRRDYEVFPNYEACGQPRFESYLHIGPKPQTFWVGAQLFVDRLFAGLRNEPIPGDHFTQNNPCQSDMLQLVKEMTDFELAACAVLCHVNQCCLTLLDTDSSSRIPLDQALDDLNQSLKTSLQKYTELRKIANDVFTCLDRDVTLPHGAYLHSAFCTLDACKGVVTFLDTFVANNKRFKQSLSKEQVLSLRKSTEQLYQFIRTDALKIKNSLYKNSAIGLLIETVRGPEEEKTDRVRKEFSGLVAKQWTERFGLDLIESWQDAIDGVLQVKIGLH